MASLGEKLKEERLKLGLSIEEVEKRTKIRSFYITALEKDDFSALPEKVYTIGFIRSYANLLNLDPQELINIYTSVYSVKNDENEDKKSYVKQKRVKRSNSPNINFNYNKLLRFGIIVLAITILFSINKFWPSKPIYTPPSQEPGLEDQIVDDIDDTKDKEVVDENTEKDNEKVIFEGVIVEIIPTRGDCWIEVTIANEIVFSKTVTQGEEKLVFESENDEIHVTFGNAGAVDVIHNGENLGSIGNMGAVERKTFSLTKGE